MLSRKRAEVIELSQMSPKIDKTTPLLPGLERTCGKSQSVNMNNQKDLPKLIIELETNGDDVEEEVGFVDVEQGDATGNVGDHREDTNKNASEEESPKEGSKTPQEEETESRLGTDRLDSDGEKIDKCEEDDSAQTRETVSETSSTSGDTDHARRMNDSSDDSMDDPSLRAGDLSVPMPMPLPTTLRRQNGRAHPEAVPGALAVEGTANPGSSRRRVVQTPHQEAPNPVVEEAQVATTDGHVIDEAVLVEEEDQEHQQLEVQEDSANGEVIEGQILLERIPASKRWFWPMAVLVLIGVIVFLALFFTLGGGEERNSTTSAGDSNDSEKLEDILYPPYVEGLPTASIKAMQIIGSPVYLANRWMLNDPNLNSYPEHRQLQRLTMAALYFGTNGDTWINKDGWLSYDVPECQWWSNTIVEELKGKPICDEDEYLTILAVANNNLTGVIADMSGFNAVPHVPKVYALDLANNNISGESPMLDSGVPIEIISISNNQFDSIAPTMGKMAFDVRYLHIDNNKFNVVGSGVLWTLFPSLESVNFTGNLFDGPFHDTMKTCKNLTYLGAGSNLLYGTLPSVLGELTKLQHLDVSGNPELAGFLPSELGLLTDLRQVDIKGTGIAQELPVEICGSNDEPFVELLANNCSSAVQCGCQ